ncbi:MAG: hypothetical protein AUJ92_19730 [Armatimonadetes bacterium CG2_30_59_28]|nr:glycosyltransferase family 9 protein [Armatimonadota bacterium]OIO90043.1 MAG: hypothetical protein AUJ92_19730 [Armatimonadetes bacterium CG2_30_59_28]PIU60508.1 MAG: hypothetical protein COS85_24035 [Armatimonadetes bacterium CG07_land_8_20_14_0_80_59_28]PIX43258.1 MAG: hypothetical protein COZ56_07665 [Armatimonadetes bacterium CG_4_8_14_3_um_filter_58_9]PIY47760.1 MAG: hypothetical protein COZ05_04665 [Armatimonadetes bacterium CG_4_10_14_3_um_filter_59_10]
MTYRFKKRRWVTLFTLVDVIGEAARRVLGLFSPLWRRGPAPAAKRAIVLRLDHIGDVLLSTPALHQLREEFPRARIAALVGPWSMETLVDNPDIDDLQSYAAPWFDRSGSAPPLLPSLIREARRLRVQRFDLGIDLRGDFRNLLLMTLAGIPYRVSYADQGGGFLLNRIAQRTKYQHEVYRSLDVAQALHPTNQPETLFEPALLFPIPAEARGRVDQLLSLHFSHGQRPLVAVHPGAGCKSKLWVAERFAEVSRELVDENGVDLVFTGSPGERDLVRQITDLIHVRHLDLTGSLTLKELGALFERCRLVVTVDGGAMHISAAVGTPTVVAFASMTTLNEWRPFGDHHIPIRKEVPCGGCELEVCPKLVRCMALISSREITDAATHILRGSRARTRQPQ